MSSFNRIIPANISSTTIEEARVEWVEAGKKYEAVAADMVQQQKNTQCIGDLLQLLVNDQKDESQVNEIRAIYFASLGADIRLLVYIHTLKMSAMVAEMEYQGCLLQKAAWDESNKIQPEDRLKKIADTSGKITTPSESEMRNFDRVNDTADIPKHNYRKDPDIERTPPLPAQQEAGVRSKESPLMQVFRTCLNLQTHATSAQQLARQLNVDIATQKDIGDVLIWVSGLNERIIVRLDDSTARKYPGAELTPEQQAPAEREKANMLRLFNGGANIQHAVLSLQKLAKEMNVDVLIRQDINRVLAWVIALVERVSSRIDD